MLWLLRHAEAADATSDDERPLTRRGRAQAQAAGEAMARLGAKLELCLTSPKVRAPADGASSPARRSASSLRSSRRSPASRSMPRR